MNSPAQLPQVLLIGASGPRYAPSDLEPYFEPENASSSNAEPVDTAILILDPNATPPFDKFEALRTLEPKFRATWDRKRTDLQDQSLSGYDMSLADMAAKDGWTNQDTMNLLIAFRRRHGGEPKLQDYYALTIGKAKALGQAEASFDTLFRGGALETGDGAMTAEAILATASTLLTLPITGVLKVQPTWAGHQRGAAHYYLQTKAGRIELGGIETITNPQLFRNRVADYTGILIPQFKKDRWDALIHGLLSACVVEDAGPEGTDRGRVSMWLEGFLAERPPLDDALEAVEPGNAFAHPFNHEGQLYILAPPLRLWLANTRDERISFKELAVLLRAHGCVPRALHLTGADKKDVSIRTWQLPKDEPVTASD